MAEPSISRFVDALAASQLLTESQLTALRKQLVGNPITAEGLVKTLVNQQHLTGWQARQLFKGRTGFVLQQYRLLNPIGRGGMGHVFRARAANVDQDVAVKVMARKLKANETLVSRFRREIRASSKLDSQHIVRTMDAGRVGTVDFMVMEYVNGDQVDRVANRLGRVPTELACEIVRQAALGLQHAHEHQMVHRDIKPANIMVHWEDSGQGIVKLMDMGLVLLMSDDIDEKTVTRAGQVMGTPDYMSPEQGWDTTQVDIRSDIYSLGCTLFRLLTGTIPFTGSNPLQVLSQRLQRDAPSVLTVCDDISAAVADVVSKMTMRDPDARYQTPQEVSEALAPLSEALTLQRLRDATRATSNDVGVISEDNPDNSSDESHEADGSYREFLKLVEEGSVVDLMLATDSGASPLIATAPLINLNIATAPRGVLSRRAGSQSPKLKRQQKTGLIAFALSVVVVAIISMVVFSGDRVGSDPVPIEVTDIVPVATIADADVATARVGKTWTHQLKADIATPPTTGELQFVVGSSAPTDLTIDTKTGAIRWPVPLAQPAANYVIPVQLVHVVDDVRRAIADTRLKVLVKPDMNAVVLPEPRRGGLLADVDQPFQLSMAIDSDFTNNLQLSYEFASPTPPGLTIDSATGLITWVPTAEQLGRHDIEVSVSQPDRSRELDKQMISLIVVPTQMKHVLPEIAPQSAKAGQPFSFDLPKPALNRPGRIPINRIIEPGVGAPPGFAISPQGKIRWDVPDDLSGTVRIALVGKLDGPNAMSRRLEGTVILEVNVTAMAKTPPPASTGTMPDAVEVSDTLAKLRDTYRISIAQARTMAEKTKLAHRYLMQCSTAESGVTDAALLQLIEEDLATKARATDVLLEIARLRAERYGISELPAAREIIKSFRKTGLTQRQQDLIIEQGLRLASDSIDSTDYAMTSEFLNAVKSLLSRSVSGASAMLYADVNSAADVAAELAKASDGAIDDLKVDELSRLINRWQFKPVFGKSSTNVFIQASATQAVPGNGQELWTMTKNQIKLESETQGGMVGFIDSAQQLDRYVVRFQLLPESNCAQLVLAANGAVADGVSAHTVVLNSSALGRINDLRNDIPLNVVDTSSLAQAFTDIPNLVEVAVDGPVVAVRLNGTLLTTATIADLSKGWLGIIADLRRPEPRLLIRQPRILILPDAN